MYVACSTLCFSTRSLDDALRTARDLHFQKVDLAVHSAGPHLTPAEVAIDPAAVAARIKATNMQVAALHVKIDESDPVEAKAHLKAVGRLARLSTTPLICVDAAPAGGDFDADVARLQDWARVAASEGVILTVETNRHTLTADPAGAVELCRRVPGLGLTLDPSHYLVGPHRPDSYDSVLKYVRHVRLRDTGATEDQFQVRVGQGQIEYGRLIAGLQRFGYTRGFTVDIRDVPEPGFPVDAEVRKLKYLLESLV